MRISVRGGWIHLRFLRQDRLDRPIELVFIHNYAGVQFLLFQTHVVQSDGAGRELVTVRSALCAALSATPPAREAAQHGTEETQQSHFPGPFHWWLTPLSSKLASGKGPRTARRPQGLMLPQSKPPLSVYLICNSSRQSSSDTDIYVFKWKHAFLLLCIRMI